MHSRIFQVSKKPIKKEDYINSDCYIEHWFTKSIADYVSDDVNNRNDDIEWLTTFTCTKGITIGEDENGKFLIVTDRKAYFQKAFEEFKDAMDKVSKYTLDDFIQGSSYEVWLVGNSYEDKFGFYIDEDGDLTTLDSFVRLCRINQKYYIGGTVDYHF